MKENYLLKALNEISGGPSELFKFALVVEVIFDEIHPDHEVCKFSEEDIENIIGIEITKQYENEGSPFFTNAKEIIQKDEDGQNFILAEDLKTKEVYSRQELFDVFVIVLVREVRMKLQTYLTRTYF